VVTDEDGRVTSRRDYTAFGEESVTPERAAGLGYAGTSETRKGYTGYEKDAESGLDFAQARYYNSKHGRFTSVDPLTASATIRNPQTFNRYTYVLNSPYKFTDPLGLIPESTVACGNRCRNSDGGSGFWMGRDASFDWAREWFGEVAGYELDQPNGQFVEDFSRNISYLVVPGSTTSTQNDPRVAAAASPTVIVNLERGGTTVATGVNINLPSAITDALENVAIGLANLTDLLDKQFAEFRDRIDYLMAKG